MDKEFEKSSATLYIVSMLANVINYCFQIFAGRYLSVEDFGTLNFILSSIVILTVPCNALKLAVSRDIVKFTSNNRSDKIATLVKQIIEYVTVFAVFFFAIGSVIIYLLRKFFNITTPWILMITIIIVIVIYYNNVIGGMAQGLLNFFLMAVLSVIFALSKLTGVALSTVMDTSYRLNIILAFMLFGIILSTFTGYFFLQKKNKILKIKNIKKMESRPMVFSLSYMLVAVAAHACVTLMMNADMLLIKWLYTNYEAGIYSSSMVFGHIIIYAVSALGTVLFTIAAKQYIQGNNVINTYIKALVYCVGIILLFSLPLFIFRRTIITIVFGEKYLPSVSFVGYSCLIAAACALCSLNINYLLAINKSKSVILICISGLVITGSWILFFSKEIESLLLALFILFIIVFISSIVFILKNSLKHEDKSNRIGGH